MWATPRSALTRFAGFTRTWEASAHLLVITHDPDDHSLMQNSIRLLKEKVGPRLEDLG